MNVIFEVALLVHVLSAIALFGPTFAFPLIGAAGGREPMHGNFAIRLTDLLESRLVMVGLVVQPISGFIVIWAAGIDFFAASSRWLVAAIVLYAIAAAVAIFIQTPTVRRMAEMSAHAPAPAAPGSAPAGPPPALMTLVRKSQRTGMILGALLVVIIALMVVKPGV
ncbi:MAG TPA: DUF2269 family protein [Candidatus Limnocylindrales bacterium]|nr:DUF2269 family protein [Candidatus Limnocylindrales bacterium]